MTWINRHQIEHLTTEANTIPVGETETGFSVSVQQGPSGELVRARDRYMVGGVPGQTGQTFDAPMTPRNFTSFVRTNRSLLNQPEMYAGAWHEGERKPKAQIDLDVSQGFPRTSVSHVAARTAALVRNERAYGEVGHEAEYAGSHVNPFSTRPLGDEGGINAALAGLRSDPYSYASVIAGSVVPAMASWINRPVSQS